MLRVQVRTGWLNKVSSVVQASTSGCHDVLAIVFKGTVTYRPNLPGGRL